MRVIKAITDRPWIFIVLFFAAFVAALAVTVVIALKNQPAEVPVVVPAGGEGEGRGL